MIVHKNSILCLSSPKNQNPLNLKRQATIANTTKRDASWISIAKSWKQISLIIESLKPSWK